MRLTILDRPPSGRFAVDENDVVWRALGGGVWGRGCLTGADALAGEVLGRHPRFVFLRPSWAADRPPLTLADFRAAKA